MFKKRLGGDASQIRHVPRVRSVSTTATAHRAGRANGSNGPTVPAPITTTSNDFDNGALESGVGSQSSSTNDS